MGENDALRLEQSKWYASRVYFNCGQVRRNERSLALQQFVSNILPLF